MEHIEYVYTVGMTESEVADRLRESEVGVLALAGDGTAYAIPVSYYYDGSSLYFRLGDDEHSRKLEFVETTDEACFVLYGVEKPNESWSIVVTGPLRSLSDAEGSEYDAAAINERFGSLRVFDEPIDEIDLVLFELEITSITGRQTAG